MLQKTERNNKNQKLMKYNQLQKKEKLRIDSLRRQTRLKDPCPTKTERKKEVIQTHRNRN